MENRNSQVANLHRQASAKQPALEHLLAMRLELESKRRQETELKVRDSERLLDKMSRMSREQETRERLILDLRRRARGDEDTVTESSVSGVQLAVAERTVKLLGRDMEELQKSSTKLRSELHSAQQDLLEKRLEVTRLSQAKLEMDVKVGKLERKVKDCWVEEDRLLEELHVAGDRIAGLEQGELDAGLASFNKIALLEEALRSQSVTSICKELVLELLVDSLDIIARN